MQGDVLSLRASTRVGTNPDDTKCHGLSASYASAAGPRLYYDSLSAPSSFEVTTTPNPKELLYLHSDGSPCPNDARESPGVTMRFLDDVAPTSSMPKCKDSGPVDFNRGNPWAVIGTWSLAPLR